MQNTRPQGSEGGRDDADVEKNSLRRQILDLTGVMGDCASSHDWSRATELAALRQNLLEALLPPGSAPDDVHAESDLIRVVLEADRQLSRLADAGRDETLAAFDVYRRGRQARKVYQQSSARGPMINS